MFLESKILWCCWVLYSFYSVNDMWILVPASLCSYEPELIKKFVLHLLMLSHAFAIPSLKRTCIKLLEQELLTTENVVDVLQLAQLCDAPQLSLVCTRLITKDLKSISVSEGWKTMKKTNPSLEQALLESLVEDDSVGTFINCSIKNYIFCDYSCWLN